MPINCMPISFVQQLNNLVNAHNYYTVTQLIKLLIFKLKEQRACLFVKPRGSISLLMPISFVQQLNNPVNAHNFYTVTQLLKLLIFKLKEQRSCLFVKLPESSCCSRYGSLFFFLQNVSYGVRL
jgi:hypothetical protein